MLKEVTDWLSANGRKGGSVSNKNKGFGSFVVRAKASAARAIKAAKRADKNAKRAIKDATRAANRARDEKEIMRQAIVRATAKRARKEVYRDCD